MLIIADTVVFTIDTIFAEVEIGAALNLPVEIVTKKTIDTFVTSHIKNAVDVTLSIYGEVIT